MTFLDRVLSLATYLLYGMNHDGFYPSKAMAGESKLTAQLRCACPSSAPTPSTTHCRC